MNKKPLFKHLLILFSIGILIVSCSSDDGESVSKDKCEKAEYNPQTQLALLAGICQTTMK